jgi:uncharacterized protein YehS (DUF1456 family)
MINNDVLRSVRYILNIHDSKIVEICKLADFPMTLDEVKSFLLRDEDPGFQMCPDKTLAYFLNGVIFLKRGKDPARPAMPIEEVMTNNIVLKKLRVAFELKESDILDLLHQSGFDVSPHELSAFFRREGHSNYRECGDQFLRNFLKGVTQKFRG